MTSRRPSRPPIDRFGPTGCPCDQRSGSARCVAPSVITRTSAAAHALRAGAIRTMDPASVELAGLRGIGLRSELIGSYGLRAEREGQLDRC